MTCELTSRDLGPVLRERLPVPTRDEAQVAISIFRLLAREGAFHVDYLSSQLGVPESMLESPSLWRLAERTADDIVVGFGGLTVNPTPIRFRTRARELYTWCAWDGLFIPELLDEVVEVDATCPETGEHVSMRVSARGVEDLAPTTAVITFVVPSPDHSVISLETTRECYCRRVRFYESRTASAKWLDENPNERVLTVGEAHALGAFKNALQYGALLTQ